MRALLAVLLSLPVGSGCATTMMSFGHGVDFSPYSGTRANISGLTEDDDPSQSQFGWRIFAALDFVPSLAVDTLLLPITVPYAAASASRARTAEHEEQQKRLARAVEVLENTGASSRSRSRAAWDIECLIMDDGVDCSRAVEPLTVALHDTAPSVRESAASALAVISWEHPVAVAPLVEALLSGDRVTSEAVAWNGVFLERNGDVVLAAFRRAGAVDDPAQRKAATQALQTLEQAVLPGSRMGQEMRRELREKPSVTELHLEALDRFPGDEEGMFVIIDRSGSGAVDFDARKQMVARGIDHLPDGVPFGVVFSDSNIMRFPEGLRPALASEQTRAAAREFVEQMPLGGGSCPLQAYRAALAYLDHSAAATNAIVYVGDGGGACKGQDIDQYLKETFEEVTLTNTGRAAMHAIGVGLTRDSENRLRAFTRKNRGTYIRILESSHRVLMSRPQPPPPRGWESSSETADPLPHSGLPPSGEDPQ